MSNERFVVSHHRLKTAAVAAVTAVAVPVVTVPSVANATDPVGTYTSPVDELGRPTPPVLDKMQTFADQPSMPDDIRSTIDALVGFFRGGGEPGADMPVDGPAFTQFGWPSVAERCIGGAQSAVGTTSAVPGPAALPLPGVGAGQISFVFTALGTGPVAGQQEQPMTVHWVNIDDGRMGSTPLTFTGINPDGPGTLDGTADTGPGTVLAVLEGGVTTDEPAGPANCLFSPTVGLINVG
ncbi:hypothetical protein [Corynebacterium nuruki]|jgi:hypothetical protein|uniref:Secreted protein n=1 Tax=Corynebacterium nuruki TaxID=1032851 RepID=A0A3D4T1H0_9CORY|nr:hypothetical protein [Corynebacterium nuruki]HCT15081.1 hypothetical protein [Corynebacterium nuruki]